MSGMPEMAGATRSAFILITASSERLTNGKRPVSVRKITTPIA